MRRGWLVVAAAVVAAACSSGDDAAPASEPAPTTSPAEAAENVIEVPAWEPATRAEELAFDMSSSGEVTLQDAVDAFGLHVDGFPGATSTDLPPGDTISASYALALILSRRDELAADQQAALDEYLGSSVVVGRVPAGGRAPEPSSEITATTAAGWRRPAATEAHYVALLTEVHQAWIDHLPGHPQHDSYELAWWDEAGESGMQTYENVDGSSLVCRIDVHTSFRDGNPSDDQIRFFLAHELFHCMQWRWAAEDANPAADPFATFPVRNPHAWLYDGSADWAAADLYRDVVIDFNNILPDWFNASTSPLSGRSYDAWPLFENAALNGYAVYDKIRAMHVSPTFDVAETLHIGGLDGVVFRMLWSSRTLRREGWGDEWEMDWVWRGHESTPPVDNDTTVGSIGLGPYEYNGVGDFSQPQLRSPVSGEVGIITVWPVGAPLTTRTKVGTRTVGDGGSGRFCFHPSGCVCPQGRTSNAWPMEPGEMLFSFAASQEQPTSTLIAVEWNPEIQCEEEEPDEGSSNGDPHLLSFDGLSYDVVTLGEFVLARDPDGDFEVQTRHEPFGFGAGTTAIAVSDGTTRVTFTMPAFLTGDVPTVRVDGAVETRSEFRAGSLRVRVGAEDSLVAWPDGSTVELHWYLGWFVKVTVPGHRSARMEGLLGASDGDLRNDLRMPDGTAVDTNDADAYESPFALAWAVDADTSLFDYDAGQSPATFRVPHPRPEPPPPDPDVVERCASALGDRAAAHDVAACAYDVTATGDGGFVAEYVAVVDAREDPPGLAETLPVLPTAPPETIGDVTEGRAGEPTLTLEVNDTGTIDAVAGTVIVARVDACDSGGFVSILVWRAGEQDLLGRADVCDPQQLGGIGLDADDEWHEGEGYAWIPDDGAYDVGVELMLGDEELVGAVEVFVDPDPLVFDAADLGDGASVTLHGIADTVVLLPDPAARFTTTGLLDACAVEMYWGHEFPHPEPRDLGACDHATSIDFPPTDRVIPVIVFSRTAGDTLVELTPAG